MNVRTIITDEQVLLELRRTNNPEEKTTGHFTGRCMNCGSDNLWDDATAYGCDCCGAIFMTGDISPRMVPNG